MILLKLFQQQSTPQSSASKNLSMQSNEELIRIVQKAMKTIIQAKLQSNASVQLSDKYR